MRSIWSILEIEETKEKEKITQAYYEKLNKVHPEEDPEGFMALRKAYEEALRLSEEENDEKEIDNSPIGQWIQKAENIYNDFPERICVENWKQLFEEEICFRLDTTEEVKERLLVFLMDHFRLPYSVWNMIEDIFHIKEEKKELYEHFPKNFIDFVYNAITYEGLITYELFEGERDADYDEFIREYYALKDLVDSNVLDKVEEAIDSLEKLEIYHPYLDVERARYYEKTKKMEQAETLLFQLHKRYPEDSYILFFLSVVYRNKGLWDKAYTCYKKLLEQNPNHYSARIGVAEYHQENKEYKKAKEEFLDLLDEDLQNDYVRECLKTVNEALIAKYKEEREKEPDNLDITMELAWSLFQNNYFQECTNLLESFKPDKEHLFDYNNLKGRNYLCEENYEQAFIYLSKWIEGMESFPKEEERKRRRLGYAYYGKACAYFNLYKKDWNEQTYLTAMEFIHKAIELEQDLSQKLSYLMMKATILFHTKRYEDSIDAYEEVLSVDSKYYPAYLGKQKAYYELGYYQEVIDNYYNAIDIYPYHAIPYIWAAKVFDEFDKYHDVINVIKRAKQAKIESDQLMLYYAEAIRNIAHSQEDTKKALELCKEIETHIHSSECDLDEKGDVYKSIALCFMDLNKYKEALKQINKALKIDPQKNNYFYIKGNIYLYLTKYKKALSIYNFLDKKLQDNEIVIYKKGLCYENLERFQKAIKAYKKVLSINPKHSTVNYRLERVYNELIENKEDKSLFESALYYATKQLELIEDDYYYIERGRIYLRMGSFKEAILDFKKAALINHNNPFAYNNIGVAFSRQKRYEEAIHYFKKAVKVLKYDKTILPYNNLAACYQLLGQNEKAVKYYLANLRLFPERPSIYTKLAELFTIMGELEKAIYYYKEGMKQPNSDKPFYLLRLGTIFEYKKDYKKAISYYRRAIQMEPLDDSGYDYLAEYYLYSAKNYKKAEKYYKKALELSKRELFYSDYTYYCLQLGKVYKQLNKKEEAYFYLQEALNLYNEAVGGIEGYVTFPGYQMLRLYDIGSIYYEMGLFEEAKKYFNRMLSCPKCNNCHYPVCYELLIGKAKICEWKNEIEKAIKYYKQALQIKPYQRNWLDALEKLQKKKNNSL